MPLKPLLIAMHHVTTKPCVMQVWHGLDHYYHCGHISRIVQKAQDEENADSAAWWASDGDHSGVLTANKCVFILYSKKI